MTYDGATMALSAGIAFGIVGLFRTDGSDYTLGLRLGIRACAATLLIVGGSAWAFAHVVIR